MLVWLINNTSISLHAMVNTPSPRTMLVQGVVNKKQVIVLIDIGNTHNFLDVDLIQRYISLLQKGTLIQVKVAKGDIVTTEGRVTTLPLCLQDT